MTAPAGDRPGPSVARRGGRAPCVGIGRIVPGPDDRPATAQVGTTAVGVTAARTGRVQLRSRPTPADSLSLTLRMTNLRDEPLTSHSWS